MALVTIAETFTWELRPSTAIAVPVASTVFWDEGSPLELRLSFHVGLDDPVEWVFARDILTDAIQKNRAGDADVHAEVDNDTMTVTLNSPFGEARFTIEASIVGQFLARTYGIVPRGKEEYDVDSVIKKILARG